MPEPPEEVFFLSNGRVAFEHAWIVLKGRTYETGRTRGGGLSEWGKRSEGGDALFDYLQSSEGQVAVKDPNYQRYETNAQPNTRQSTLGEFHPDLPSPYGDVQYYHGTTVAPASRIKTEGLKPAQPWYNAQFDNHPKGVYATTDLDLATGYAGMRGEDKNQAGRVFGIRGSIPEIPTSSQTMEGDVRFNEDIPRQYITPVPMQKSQLLLWPPELNNYRDPDTGMYTTVGPQKFTYGEE